MSDFDMASGARPMYTKNSTNKKRVVFGEALIKSGVQHARSAEKKSKQNSTSEFLGLFEKASVRLF